MTIDCSIYSNKCYSWTTAHNTIKRILIVNDFTNVAFCVNDAYLKPGWSLVEACFTSRNVKENPRHVTEHSN